MSDPYGSSVSLLLHCDGTNGSTTFTDNSGAANIVTAYGNAQISTTQSKFGGSSAYFDGIGDYLMTISAACCDFGASDFTVEFWMYKPSAGLAVIINSRGTATNNPGIEIGMDATNHLYFYDLATNTVRTTTTTFSLNTWTHIAVSRAANTLKLFINGTSGYSGTNSASIGATALQIGRWAGGESYSFSGYLDEIRFTKGVARYTADFTAPTEAFPNPDPPQVFFMPPSLRRDMEFGGNYRIAGTAKRLNQPTQRRVRLFDRRTGLLVREVWSSPTDGVYSFDWLKYQADGYFVVEYDNPEESTPYNAAIADLITPDVMT